MERNKGILYAISTLFFDVGAFPDLLETTRNH